MRLDKYLAEAGRGTRTEVKRLIAKKRVTVNGAAARDPAMKINEDSDTVELDGEPVVFVKLEYYMLNKPQGVISASKAERVGTAEECEGGVPCVTDLITDKIRDDLFPVGRLDKDTEGLLIITNDGAMAHRLLSPKKHVDKTYYVELDGRVGNDAAVRLSKGVDIGDEKPTQPCTLNILSDESCLITIHEGRYHQIKRMFATEGLTVTALKRISMGPLSLDPELKPGEYRRLTAEEVEQLKGEGKPGCNGELPAVK